MKKYSTQDILNMPFSELQKMSTSDLRKAVTAVNSTANKRLARLEKAGFTKSYAYQNAMKEGKFSTKGKTRRNDVYRELARARQFLTMKTSGVRGARKAQKFATEQNGGHLTEEQNKTFWDIYRKIEEQNNSEIIKQYYGSNNAQDDILKMIDTGYSQSDILEKIQSNLENKYLEERGRERERAEKLKIEFNNPLFD